ncbi:bifunctional glycosyltransferase family 2 protein/CDP-glycerol:glycerophosphate glycerophosphotransferase [Streptomyces sp. A3M-1-3]|uniref:bifunctional glycosyltransferase/CDP-glycerol:glycerophosphate glycerophosphotransferase n=1 Tax=Streptomyces sp. A3M-1-3 TaxID=2962044 RepID=UPI0020B86FE6|nr:CDP-glycerol glycerophosphotransferase family protein [Streptomyces sp. A3M-1-3]MCP3822169.1 bifunctional glycosyltransferase family 2 protein/CDP-glycerol:glycerophosphate glycerophosphotransferase [Streptomyces sp. A3M-1-3]
MTDSEMSCLITGGPGGPAALRASVASVLAQTLRATEAVLAVDAADEAVRAEAAALAARHPDRVRTVVAGQRAGGVCVAALRNLALDAARGRYVLVFGEGERLEDNACRNLWEAAQRTGADLVAGRWSQLHPASGKEKVPGPLAELYARSRTVHDIADVPELVVRDALVAGFCLRRESLERHGLRYAEDLAYSEILFGARAATTARTLTLVPNLITQGRPAPAPGDDLAGLVEAHGRVGHLLVRQGLTALRDARDRAFVTDRLLPLALTFPARGRAERARIAAEAAARLAGRLDPQRWLALPPAERVCVQLLVEGDPEGVRDAAYALARPGTVVSPLTESDGRVYWRPGAVDDARSRTAFDVTELGFQHLPFARMRLLNRLTLCRRERGRLVLEGSLVLPLGALPDVSQLGIRLDFRVRNGGDRSFRAPVEEVRHEGTALSWRATVDLARVLRARGLGDPVWDARLVLEADGAEIVTDLLAEPELVAEAGTFPARPRLGTLCGDTWQPYVTAKHHLAVKLRAHGLPAHATRALLHYATHFRPARALKRLLKTARRRYDRLGSQAVKARVYHRWFCRLPVRSGTVVFESHMGGCYGDSPRAIHEEVRRRALPLRCVWSYAHSPAGFPADARLVRRWSWRYLWALARAEFWIDNQGFPPAVTKRHGTTYVQTWHGSAYKRMGFDELRVRTQNAPQRLKLTQAVSRFDHFLVRSEHDERTLARAYRLPPESLLRTGYPRNDVLLAAKARDEAKGRFPRPPLAAALGIEDHRKVVLYAPTFRGTPGRGRRRARPLPLDVRRFAERFGDTHVLLVRAHYLDAAELPPCPPGSVVDVSAHHDVSELLCLADVLITDYSSVMFDYALLDRPIVLFAPDLDAYTAARGGYFDLRAEAPGPVTETEDELLKVMAELKTADLAHQEARRRFAEQYGAYDRGDAARTVTDLLMARRTVK